MKRESALSRDGASPVPPRKKDKPSPPQDTYTTSSFNTNNSIDVAAANPATPSVTVPVPSGSLLRIDCALSSGAGLLPPVVAEEA